MAIQKSTAIQNAKDLKFYRFIIAMTFVVSIIIALVVGISTISSERDSYIAQANVTNTFIDIFMPSSITDPADDDTCTAGMTFFCERNKEYDAVKDQPIDAFKYYYETSKGEKIYLEEGVYYSPEYYMENTQPGFATSAAVYVAFYHQAVTNINVFVNALKIVLSILGVLVFCALIYIWYRSWSRREDERQARQKEFNEQFSKK